MTGQDEVPGLGRKLGQWEEAGDRHVREIRERLSFLEAAVRDLRKAGYQAYVQVGQAEIELRLSVHPLEDDL
jgi:hypothetical protein